MNRRMIVCYICGREYGSLSIDIHIPKCLEKWQVQNDKLPRSQRRPAPVKPIVIPDIPIGGGRGSQSAALERANIAATEAAANSNLITCNNCGRRFLPVQLPRHQKACRPGVITFKRTKSAVEARQAIKPSPRKVIIVKAGTRPPIMVPGTRLPAARLTERILARSNVNFVPISTHMKGSAVAQPMRGRPNPGTATGGSLRGSMISARGRGIPSARSSAPSTRPSIPSAQGSTRPSPISSATPSPKEKTGPATRVCYICGREFGTRSIDIHEPQCLEKWKVQNSKVPSAQRRPEPQKPTSLPGVTTRLTRDQINEQAYDTFKNNLSSCQRCGRRFLPDRRFKLLNSWLALRTMSFKDFIFLLMLSASNCAKLSRPPSSRKPGSVKRSADSDLCMSESAVRHRFQVLLPLINLSAVNVGASSSSKAGWTSPGRSSSRSEESILETSAGILKDLIGSSTSFQSACAAFPGKLSSFEISSEETVIQEELSSTANTSRSPHPVSETSSVVSTFSNRDDKSDLRLT